MPEIEHRAEVKRSKITKGTAVFSEADGIIRTLYIEKGFFKGKEIPENITVTVSFSFSGDEKKVKKKDDSDSD